MATPLTPRQIRGGAFANVCSLLALLVAVGTGTAYAASSVGSADIINRSIRSIDIKNGQLKSRDLAAGAVTGAGVLDGSLTVADLAGADVDGGGISVPAGYVPNGRCRQLDASVGGATAGEAAIFNVQSPLQDGVVLYGQRVPSDGHVMFDVCNFSGTTQAAINDLPVRLITFG